MKKQLLSIVSGVVLCLGVQVADAQISGGNLETWQNFGGLYDDPTSNLLKTLNIIATFPENPPVTCFKTDTAHTGQWAARIHSTPGPLGIFVPGVLGTVTPFFTPNIGCTLQEPYVGRPASIKAWIQYKPQLGDSGQIFSYLLKDNGGGSYETLAVAKRSYLFAINDWEEQSLDYTYTNTTDVSTHLSLVFISSADYDFSNLTQCHGSPNSKMYVDDVELVGYNGISEMLFTGEEINVYPNPAQNMLNMTLSQTVTNGTLSVIDLNGREVLAQTVNGSQFSLDITTLNAGSYVAAIKEGNRILGRKTFVKK